MVGKTMTWVVALISHALAVLCFCYVCWSFIPELVGSIDCDWLIALSLRGFFYSVPVLLYIAWRAKRRCEYSWSKAWQLTWKNVFQWERNHVCFAALLTAYVIIIAKAYLGSRHHAISTSGASFLVLLTVEFIPWLLKRKHNKEVPCPIAKHERVPVGIGAIGIFVLGADGLLFQTGNQSSTVLGMIAAIAIGLLYPFIETRLKEPHGTGAHESYALTGILLTVVPLILRVILVLVGGSVTSQGASHAFSLPSRQDILVIVLLGIVVTALPDILFGWVLHREKDLSMLAVVIIGRLGTLLAMTWAWIGGHPPTWGTALGCAAIIVSVVLRARAKKRQETISEADLATPVEASVA